MATFPTHPAKSLPINLLLSNLASLSTSREGQGMADLPASHRLRIGRFSEPNRIYLITTNTHERIPIFNNFHLARLVVWQFRLAQ